MPASGYRRIWGESDNDKSANSFRRSLDNVSGGQAFPSSGMSGEGVFVIWPIVQCCVIEIGAVPPHQRFYLRIDGNLVE